MKNYFMNYCMKTIASSTLHYSEEKLEEIAYGLEAIYIFITKTIIIFTIAYFLHIIMPLLIFLIIYNLIKMPSFGLHATKSIYCLLSSLLIFIGGTFLSVYLQIPLLLKSIIGIYCILRMFQNAPADTYKRPIVNQKRRDTYKIVSTLLAILFVFLSVLIQEQFLSNAFLIALIIQVCIISPYIYKLFHLRNSSWYILRGFQEV